ncbi:hypothetical protein [Pseudomonas rhodesiae]|uniref:hypothetical protein n=1 Tax=Pseudomonas rhodesiae TaxID=76760 RepID=UPI0032B238E8
MSDSGLGKIWAALRRIKAGKPLVVSPDDQLSYDLICLEAGFGRGYLKAGRPQHDEVRAAISEEMKLRGAQPRKLIKATVKDVVKKKNAEISALKAKYELVLNREVMLIQHIYNLEEQLHKRGKPRLVYSQSKPE